MVADIRPLPDALLPVSDTGKAALKEEHPPVEGPSVGVYDRNRTLGKVID